MTEPEVACACIGPPTFDGDPRCVCARLAAEEGRPWPRWDGFPVEEVRELHDAGDKLGAQRRILRWVEETQETPQEAP